MKTRTQKSYVFYTLLFFLFTCSATISLVGLFGAVAQADEASSAVAIDRMELPVKSPYEKPITTLDVRNAKAPPLFQLKAPQDAHFAQE